MKQEWYVAVAQKCEPERWCNVAMWDKNMKFPGQRYYKTEEAARKALAHAYEIWNGVKQYDANGKREEVTDVVNGFGISTVFDKKIDDDMRIVDHIIRVRQVTDWETVG